MVEVNPYNPNFATRNNAILRANGQTNAMLQMTLGGGREDQRTTNFSLQGEWNSIFPTGVGVQKLEFFDDDGIHTGSSFKFYSTGVFSASGGKSFVIDHPILSNKELTHVAIEAPRGDLIYRGRVKMENGKAVANIDESGNMTDGTFVALTRS